MLIDDEDRRITATSPSPTACPLRPSAKYQLVRYRKRKIREPKKRISRVSIDPAADAAVMEIDPQHPDIIVKARRKYRQCADRPKSAIQDKTGKRACDEGYHRIVRNAAAPDTDRGKYGRKTNQPDIASDGTAGIDPALTRQLLDTKEIDQGRQKGDQGPPRDTPGICRRSAGPGKAGGSGGSHRYPSGTRRPCSAS